MLGSAGFVEFTPFGVSLGGDNSGVCLTRGGVYLKSKEFGQFFAPLGGAVAVVGGNSSCLFKRLAAVLLFLVGDIAL